MKWIWKAPIGVLCGVALATAAQVQRTVLVSVNKTSAAEEAANKNVVLDFWRDFFNYREFDQGASLYLAPGFRNHDPYEPSNPQRYADFVRKDLEKVPPIPERAKMFVVAEGDLVLLAELGDASQTRFSANLARVRGGKMVEMWYTGATTDPPSGQVLFDKSRENPKAGPTDLIGRKALVPLHPSSSAQELANKRLVLDYWRDFYDAHRFEQAAGKYLAADFREHYSGAPSGAADYAAFEKTRLSASRGSETGKLFVIAEGDLVALAELNEKPEASFQVHLLRVSDGRISDHWYSGPTRSAPPPGMDVQPIDKSKDQ
jgi:predicted SnoaL-like aldol condensation-catalyzing enzyme